MAGPWFIEKRFTSGYRFGTWQGLIVTLVTTAGLVGGGISSASDANTAAIIAFSISAAAVMWALIFGRGES